MASPFNSFTQTTSQVIYISAFSFKTESLMFYKAVIANAHVS